MDVLDVLSVLLPVVGGGLTYGLARRGGLPSWWAGSLAVLAAAAAGVAYRLVASSDGATILVTAVVFGLLAGGVAVALVGPEVRGWRGVLVGVGSALLVGVGYLVVLYLAPLAFLGAAAVYWVAGRMFRISHALVASAVAFAGLLVVFGIGLYTAVGAMS